MVRETFSEEVMIQLRWITKCKHPGRTEGSAWSVIWLKATDWREFRSARGEGNDEGDKQGVLPLPQPSTSGTSTGREDRWTIHWSHHPWSEPTFSRLKRRVIGWRHRKSRPGEVKKARPARTAGCSFASSLGHAASWLEFCFLCLSLTLTSGPANRKLSMEEQVSGKQRAQAVTIMEQRGCRLTSYTCLQMSTICLAELHQDHMLADGESPTGILYSGDTPHSSGSVTLPSFYKT